MDEEVRSCMFAFHGLHHGSLKASYLYGLCTENAYRGRGMGKAVVEFSARCAIEKGADAVFLRAADDSLRRWYISEMGALPAAPFSAFRIVPGTAAEKAKSISPQEYFSLRRGSWLLPPSLLLAQGCIHRHFGGDFLRLGNACLCAETSDKGILIRELSAEQPEKLLAAAAEHFGVRELYVLREDPDGTPLLFIKAQSIDSLTGLSPMPVTLD